MNNAEYWVNSGIGTEDISYLLPNLGPLLKLLSTEFKTDLGDRLAKSYAHKTTSCETLTSYAVRGLVDTLINHMQVPMQKSKNTRKPPMNVPQAALQAFEKRPTGNNLNEVSEELPAKTLLQIFLGHENKVWFRVILVILFCCPAGGDPPRRDRFAILQDEQKIKLLKAFMLHHIDKKVEKSVGKGKGLKPKKTNLSYELKKALGGNNKHPCKIALQDLLFFLSRHSTDLEAVCTSLGPALFTPLDTRHFSRYLQSLKGKGNLLREITSKLMLFMANNINNIFPGRTRSFERDIDNAIMSFSPSDSGQVKRTRLKQHLRHFFEIRDPICKRIVVPLFEYYEFDDIARGILAKYRLLPHGWKSEVESNIADLPAGLFDMPTRAPQTSGNDYTKINGSYFDSNDRKENHSKPNSDYVMNKMTNNGTHRFLAKYLSKNSIKYLSDKTVFWNDITSTKIYAPRNPRATKVDKIVDEFIDKQRKLLATLKNFTTFYVAEVAAISAGHLGQDAQKALYLSSSEVRTIFKNNFKEVQVAQEKFVTTLEPLLLCKSATLRPQYASYERAGILFLLFIKCQKLIIKGFQNYNVNYSVKTETLQRLQTEALKLAEENRGAALYTNFVDLWEEISTTKTSLTAKKLGTILYLPVQAVPQYKIFFERILKTLGPEYPHKEIGEKAIKVAENISIALDKNLKKSKDKINQILGD